MKNIQSSPVLRFSPTAWAKLIYMRDLTYNEVGGFGITETDDLLLVNDFVIVKQRVSSVTVSFYDEAVANFFEDQVDLGRKPQQFSRIWVHTHPDMSPEPSSVDEETFQRVFGSCDWSVMFIISSSGDTYARLRFNAGPGGEMKIPVSIDYSKEFEGSDFSLWDKLYLENVEEKVFLPARNKRTSKKSDKQEVFGGSEEPGYFPEDIFDIIEEMDPMERQMFIDELSYRSEYWDNEEVCYE